VKERQGEVTDYVGFWDPKKARRAGDFDHLLMYQEKNSKGASQAAKSSVQAVQAHTGSIREAQGGA
jgi:hypothetical protein